MYILDSLRNLRPERTHHPVVRRLQRLRHRPGAALPDDAPVDVDNPVMIQGALEGSNIQPILEISKMIETHRAFDSVRSFIDREDQRQKKMIEQLSPRV